MTNRDKNNLFITIHNNIEQNKDCLILFEELEKYNLSEKEIKSLISLKLRYYIKNNMITLVDNIYNNNKLMNRDYWLIIEYYYNMKDDKYREIIDKNIKNLTTYDIDLMIENDYYDLIREWDGFPVISYYESNTSDYTMLKKYNYNIDGMKEIYKNKIPSNYLEKFNNMIKDCDILIDGANISHETTFFNFNVLKNVIQLLEDKNYKPKIILHERHIINNNFLQKYIVRTPKNNYDDNFLLYGMFQYNKMIVSNDLFRDHAIDMDNTIKCYIEMMTIQYIDKKLIIPQYSKCIQVINNSIYIPTKKGFFIMKK